MEATREKKKVIMKIPGQRKKMAAATRKFTGLLQHHKKYLILLPKLI